MNIELAFSITAIVIAIVSIIMAYNAVTKQIRVSHYTYLANKWYEIKEKELDYPDFMNPSKTSSYKTSFKGDLLKKYETLAWICWGHAEDVYRNKWHKDIGFKSSINWCKRLHYSWLKEQHNRERFDPRFLRYIDEL